MAGWQNISGTGQGDAALVPIEPVIKPDALSRLSKQFEGAMSSVAFSAGGAIGSGVRDLPRNAARGFGVPALGHSIAGGAIGAAVGMANPAVMQQFNDVLEDIVGT